MKPKNFPARKLRRKLKAAGKDIHLERYERLIRLERIKKTKKC